MYQIPIADLSFFSYHPSDIFHCHHMSQFIYIYWRWYRSVLFLTVFSAIAQWKLVIWQIDDPKHQIHDALWLSELWSEYEARILRYEARFTNFSKSCGIVDLASLLNNRFYKPKLLGFRIAPITEEQRTMVFLFFSIFFLLFLATKYVSLKSPTVE